MDIDEAITEAGIWGKYQIILYAIVTFGSVPNAFLTLQYVFAHYEPSHHCKFPDAILNLTKNFSMVCEDDWLPSLVLTIYMAGMGAGGLIGAVADRIGRRPVFLGSSIMQVLCMVVASFSWNFTSYLLASFLCGMTSLLNYVAAFVLATEMTAVKWRSFFAMGTMYSFTIGYCFVAFIAYFIQDWKTLLLVLAGLSAVIYAPILWIFPESARWLVRSNRTEEGLKELKRIANMNGKREHFESVLREKGNKIVARGVAQAGIKDTFRVLFGSSLAARSITAVFSWFVTSLVYYCISLYSTSFSDDRFLNVFFAGLAEFPVFVAGFYMVKTVGRPRTLSLLMVICALSNVVLPFVPEDAAAAKTVLSMVGKGAVSAAFYVVYLIGSEIAPTLQRSACLAACSVSARIASLIAPFLMYTRKFHPLIPNGIMVVIGFACAGVVIFCVPETRGVRMPDTEEDAKRNRRIYGLNIFQKFATDKTNISEKERKGLDQEAVLL